MDFNYTREQEMVRKLAKQFAEEIVEPEAGDIDREHRFPMEAWKKMVEYGLVRVNHGEAYGGMGRDAIAEMIVIEELSRVSLTHGAMYALMGHGFPTFIEMFGTEAQKREYIPKVILEGAVCAFDMTEPDAGSDASGLSTTSTRTEDGYVVNGTKCFITAGDVAEYHLVVARADEKAGEKGFNGFIIPANAPGVSIGKVESKMGIRGLTTAEVVFDEVHVTEDQLLGGKAGIGKMMRFALGTLDAARIGTGAQAIGVAAGAYERAVKYSGERVQFGRPINANQGIKWYIADMACKLDMARLLVYRAAAMENEGKPISKEAAMAKLYASKFGKEIVDTALQIHGGFGYMNDYPLERMYRDIKITEIYEGSSEIMKIVIANNILPRDKKKGGKR